MTPWLVGAGDISDVKPLYIAGERKILMTLSASTTMANALGLLVSCFYVFNIKYPASKTGIHKIGVIYCTILNLPPKFRSSLSNCYLVAFYNTSDAKLHGFDSIL